MRRSRTREKVDAKLLQIMRSVHKSCVEAGQTYAGKADDYLTGANLAGFVKVSKAMQAFEIV